MKKSIAVFTAALAFSLTSCTTASKAVPSSAAETTGVSVSITTGSATSASVTAETTTTTKPTAISKTGRRTGISSDMNDPSKWKAHKYADYGFEFACPQSYRVEESSGHSPMANPEYGERISLYSTTGDWADLDIDQITKEGDFADKYHTAEEFIQYQDYPFDLQEEYTANEESHTIYGVKGQYYRSYFENDKTIFELTCTSRHFLKKIMGTFKLI